LVPPVPPIPSAITNSSAPGTPSYSIEDQHFFVPGDLRDSTYSGNSDGRNSTYTRNSISPSLARSSVATTIYRNNAIVSPTPAQAAVRSKAAIVSVRNGQSPSGSGTPGNVTPPVPSIDYQRFNNNNSSNNANAPSPLRDGSIQRPVMVKMPSSSDSIPRPSLSGSQRSGASQGPTFVGKPTAITMTKGKTMQKGDDSSSVITSTTTGTAESHGLGFPSSFGRNHSKTNSIDSGSTHARAQHAVTQRESYVDDDSDIDSIDPHSRSRHSLLGDNLRALAAMRDSGSVDTHDTPATLLSPFTDASQTSSPNIGAEMVVGQEQGHVRKSSGMLSTVAEGQERSRPVSHQRPLKAGVGRGNERRAEGEESDGNRSPFEDEHEVQ